MYLEVGHATPMRLSPQAGGPAHAGAPPAAPLAALLRLPSSAPTGEDILAQLLRDASEDLFMEGLM